MSRSFIGPVVVVAVAVGVLGCGGQDPESSGALGEKPTRAGAAAPAKPSPKDATEGKSLLAQAHDAYLAGDMIALGERLRDVLGTGPSPAVRANAMELLDKAFESKKGKLPSSFKVPPGVTGLQYACFRVASPHGAAFSLRFRGETPDASHIVNMSVTGGGIHLDRAAGRGRFHLRHDPGTRSAGREEFMLDSGHIDGVPTDDAVELRVALDDGITYGGFVLTHALCSSGSPEVSVAAVTAETTPSVAWKPFLAPEAKPFEWRRYGVQLNREGEDPVLWERWSRSGEQIVAARLGSDEGRPAAPLKAGRYWVNVSESEHRAFGPVDIIRISRTMAPFTLRE